MSNLPQSLSMGVAFGGGGAPTPSSSGGAGAQGSGAGKDRKMASAEQLVLELSNPELRENALLELSKKRELFQDLAPLLWNSFGTIAALLQEIVSIYPVLSPPNLTPAQSNRVCNALALLQCVASHPDTRMLFLNGIVTFLIHVKDFELLSDSVLINFVLHVLIVIELASHIPLYLYPFLNTTSKSRPFEYLRLTSLGVIGALVKVDDTEVISFLLSTEIIPLCLRTMEMGSELSKTVEFTDSSFFAIVMGQYKLYQDVATFIVQKILLDDVGLDYICTTAERFFAVGRVLGNMVAALAEQPSSRLLKHIIRCYLRLSDNPRACDALRSCLPDMLRDATFSTCLREDPTTRRWLQQLLHNVGVNRVPALQAGGGFDHMIVT
ncbi:CCR4-NOT transcription complex subunit 9 [Glycine soja]